MNLLVIVIYLPLAGAIIGLITKWAAIKLIFWPSTYVGVGPVGWQGIVQRRSPKFAAGVADTVTGTAISVGDLLGRLDGDAIAAALRPAVEDAAPHLARACLAAASGDESAVPSSAIESLASRLPERATVAIKEIVRELAPIAPEHIDLRQLVIDLLSGANADRLARLTKKVAANELRWVIWYGGILGFAIGAVGVIGVAAFERWWMLPVIGAVDGLVNNYLAIQMIFRPFQPTRYLGIFPYQGLFPARQAEISREYGAMMAEEVLSPTHLIDRFARDAGALLPHAMSALDRAVGPLAQDVADALGVEADESLRSHVLFGVIPNLVPALAPARPAVEAALVEQLGVADTIEKTLASMPKEDFEHVLRGIFEEDEMTLIALGGVLGAGIGTAQAGLLIALGLA